MDQIVDGLLQFDRFALDLTRGCLRVGDEDVGLPPKAFEVLRYLAAHAQRLVAKQELCDAVWANVTVSDDSLVQCIRELRQKLGDDKHLLIKTVPRRGYLLDAKVTLVPAPRINASIETSFLPLPDRPSVAVLSFTNMSGDPYQDYFADGVADEIITALSRCNWLFVISRNSSFTYKGKAVDVRQVGRELGVRYVLEGSVRRAGNRLRITGQLVDAQTGLHLWADRFEGKRSEVFHLQDRITQSVVAAIEPKLQLAEIRRLQHKAPADLDAYDLLLRAQALEYEFTQESLAEALRCLKQALAIDPCYAAAMALAALCHAGRRNQGWIDPVDPNVAEAVELAERAVELGYDDANVLLMSAWATWRLTPNLLRAKDLADRALILNPNSATALAIGGWADTLMGNPNKGLELLTRAERLSPQDPRGWFIAAGMAFAEFQNGQFETAKMWANKALVQNPRYSIALRFLAASLAKSGEADRAKTVIRQVLSLEPDLTLTKLRARLQHINERVWMQFAEGLRLAGLPD